MKLERLAVGRPSRKRRPPSVTMTLPSWRHCSKAVSYTHLDVYKRQSWTRTRTVMKKLLADQEVWDKSLRTLAAQKLTTLANEWLADNDQTDRNPKKDPITEEEFARRILLTEFTVSPGGSFTAWYEDDDMFWGHVITVEGTLKKGPLRADMQG